MEVAPWSPSPRPDGTPLPTAPLPAWGMTPPPLSPIYAEMQSAAGFVQSSPFVAAAPVAVPFDQCMQLQLMATAAAAVLRRWRRSLTTLSRQFSARPTLIVLRVLGRSRSGWSLTILWPTASSWCHWTLGRRCLSSARSCTAGLSPTCTRARTAYPPSGGSSALTVKVLM